MKHHSSTRSTPRTAQQQISSTYRNYSTFCRSILLFALWGVLTGPAFGCVSGQRLWSSNREYGMFRKSRLSATAEGRLLAAQVYLHNYPKGKFIQEVEKEFIEQEQRYFEQQRTSKYGLERYLTVLPDGPHSVEAQAKISEFNEKERIARHDDLLRMADKLEARLAKAQESREFLLQTFAIWLQNISNIHQWQQPTHALPVGLQVAFRKPPHPGKCTEFGCRRTDIISFEIPVAGGGLEQRAGVVELVFTLVQGGVVAVRVRGTALFSRLWEAKRGRPLDPDPMQARVDSLTFALDSLKVVFPQLMTDPKCHQPLQPMEVVRKKCDGRLLLVGTGANEGEDDWIELRQP
jgi:hypothetical protein